MARLTDHEHYQPFKADIFGNGAADEGTSSSGTDQGLMDQLNAELAAAKAAEAATNPPPAAGGRKVVSAGATHLLAANQAKATTKAAPGIPRLVVNPDGSVTNLNAPGGGAVNTPGGLNMKAPKKTLGQGIFSGFKPQNVLLTAGGAAIGFLLGGPIGAAAGVAVGGGADYFRAKQATKTSTTKKGQ